MRHVSGSAIHQVSVRHGNSLIVRRDDHRVEQIDFFCGSGDAAGFDIISELERLENNQHDAARQVGEWHHRDEGVWRRRSAGRKIISGGESADGKPVPALCTHAPGGGDGACRRAHRSAVHPGEERAVFKHFQKLPHKKASGKKDDHSK